MVLQVHTGQGLPSLLRSRLSLLVSKEETVDKDERTYLLRCWLILYSVSPEIPKSQGTMCKNQLED